MNAQLKPFHTVAYILRLQQERSEYLLIRRSGKYLNGNWQMVSGGLDPHETAWQGAIREMREETGLVPDRFYSADFVESFYEVPREAIVFAPVFVAFIDTEQKIRLSPKEHDAYKWLSYRETLEHLEFDNQQRALQHIEKNFVAQRPNERFRIHF